MTAKKGKDLWRGMTAAELEQFKAFVSEGKSGRWLARHYHHAQGWAEKVAAALGMEIKAPAPNGGDFWTKAEDACLLEGRRRGKTYAEIAVEIQAVSGRVTPLRNICNRYHRLIGSKAYSVNRYRRPGLDEPPPERKQRRCLGRLCGGVMFESDGPGNRLCPRCAGHVSGVHVGPV
jgi:hypothetical protein